MVGEKDHRISNPPQHPVHSLKEPPSQSREGEDYVLEGRVFTAILGSMPTSKVGGPVPTHARQGRKLQRYGEQGERLLAGCIPFRSNGEDPESIEVLMVTRGCGEGLVFPKSIKFKTIPTLVRHEKLLCIKGGWEIDEDTAEKAAKRETVEEAGVRGDIEGPLIGEFPFWSHKQNGPRNDLRCTAYMYALRVREELDNWPEQAYRLRTWLSIGEASQVCFHDWMRLALHLWIQRQGWQHVFGTPNCAEKTS